MESLKFLSDWLYYPIPIAVLLISISIVVYVFGNLYNQTNKRFDIEVTKYQERIKHLEKLLDKTLNKRIGGNKK